MSRTDKDMPWWVVSDWYEPDHNHCTVEPSRYRSAPPRECDLPPVPVRQYPQRWRRDRPCTWSAVWPNDIHRYAHSWGPTKEDRHLMWYGRDRARARDLLHEACKEYHGSGDVGIMEPTEQHRHSPGRGYWD